MIFLILLNKYTKTLDWCEKLGVKAVTLFAFSIENFKRTTSEVTSIMKLAEEKFNKMLDKNGYIIIIFETLTRYKINLG
jgi:ditrans,polycis-polyprenyl diphosphate synthase